MSTSKNILLVYVAGAYSGDVVANIAKAEQASIELIRHGWHVITPHKNTSGYERYEDGTITKNTWLEMDMRDVLAGMNGKLDFVECQIISW